MKPMPSELRAHTCTVLPHPSSVPTVGAQICTVPAHICTYHRISHLCRRIPRARALILNLGLMFAMFVVDYNACKEMFEIETSHYRYTWTIWQCYTLIKNTLKIDNQKCTRIYAAPCIWFRMFPDPVPGYKISRYLFFAIHRRVWPVLPELPSLPHA